MAHPHSAGWSSGDWHRPIINLPFHWCPLGFFLLPFFFYFFIIISVLLIFKLLFFYSLCLSSSTLYHLSMRVLAMFVDSNFVFEFIAWVMVIMLVYSICQKWIHVSAWLALRVVHESTTFKGMRKSLLSCISSLFYLKLTGCCVFWLYGPGTHCHP